MGDVRTDVADVEELSDSDISLLFNMSFREYFYLFRTSEKDMHDYNCPLLYFKSINRDLLASLTFFQTEEKICGTDIDESEAKLNIHEQYTKKKNEVINSLIKCFRIVAYFIEKHSFFSLNEEIDDIPTSSLKYILISFLLGHLSCESPDIKIRETKLKHAIIYLKQYLTTVEMLGLMRPEDMKVWMLKNDISQGDEQQDNNKSNFHTKTVFSRNEKIERAKYEDAADKNILLILKQRRSLMEDEFDLDSGDENTLRELLIEIIKRFAAEALTHLDLSNEELNLLRNTQFIEKNALRKKQSNETSNKSNLDIYSVRNSNDLRLFYRKIIFSPDYILPSISLAECAAREMELEVNILGKPKLEKKKDQEEEELKARKWDDWKDENPKGIGNKMKNVG